MKALRLPGFSASIFCVLSVAAHAADGTWNVDGNGTWTTASNWAGSTIADGSGSTANFTNNITGVRTVTVAADRTIGNLVFSDSGGSTNGWILTGNTLTLAGGTPAITTTNNATISSNLAGTSGFTKEGEGTLTINTNTSNTITGTITINAGKLSLVNTTTPASNTNKLATTAVVALGGGTLEYIGQDSGYNQIQNLAGIAVNAGSSVLSVSRTGTASAFIIPSAFSRSVGGTVNFLTGTGTNFNTNGLSSTNGIASGGALYNSNTWAVFTAGTNQGMSGLASFAAPGSSTSTSNVDVTASANLAGVDSAANSLRFNTAAATTLTLSGAATITSGGILVTSTVGNNASVITGGTSLAGAAGLDLIIHQNNTANSLTIATDIVNNTTATGLTKSGAGKLIVSGTNSYTGDTFINTGTLEVQGSIANSNSISNRASLIFNSGSAQSYGNAISGVGTLEKTGSGTLTLSGTNGYTGTTTVTAGTLLVNGSTHVSSAVSVAANATLGGTGAIGGSVSVTGILAPGASIESLTTGSMSLTNGAILKMELADTSAAGADLLGINGDLLLNGVVTLDLTKIGASTWALNDKLTLASYTGIWNGGLLTYGGNAISDGGQLTFDGMNWTLDYNDTVKGSNFVGDANGSYLTLTAVPEPAAAFLGGVGLLLLLRRRR